MILDRGPEDPIGGINLESNDPTFTSVRTSQQTPSTKMHKTSFIPAAVLLGSSLLCILPSSSTAQSGRVCPPNKRGLGNYHTQYGDQIRRTFSGYNSLGQQNWWYNWVSYNESWTQNMYTESQNQGVEFVPMCWNANCAGNWGGIQELSSRLASIKKYNSFQNLLGFNEPNQGDQANMNEKDAAALWWYLEDAARDNNLKLISPAASNPYHPWFNNWLSECDKLYCTNPSTGTCQMGHHCKSCNPNSISQRGCKLDKYAIHIYECTTDNFKAAFQKALDESQGLPIWITELGCESWSSSYDKVTSYDQMAALLKSMIDVLDPHPNVERYAWWEPFNDKFFSLLTSNAEKTTLVGDAYATYKRDCSAPTPSPTKVPTAAPTQVPTAAPTAAPAAVNVTDGRFFFIKAKHSAKYLWGGPDNGTPVRQADMDGSGNQKWKFQLYSPEGSYSIINQLSGKSIDIDWGARETDGAKVQVWDFYTSTNQRFKLVPQNDGTFMFQAVISSKYLDVSGWSSQSGAPIIQWTFTGGDNQRFFLEQV